MEQAAPESQKPHAPVRSILRGLYDLRVTILTWIILAGIFAILANVLAASV